MRTLAKVAMLPVYLLALIPVMVGMIGVIVISALAPQWYDSEWEVRCDD